MVGVAGFRRQVWAWYRTYGRHNLPWRLTRDPYRILVSEVMLQQTQVVRVLPKYAEFLQAFPSVSSLARAPLPKLLKVWQGLGYNRRALNLRKLAQVVVEEYDGRLPKRVAELEQLPGVGPYTARAVATLAFNQPLPLVETNIRKVLLHQFFSKRRRVPDSEVAAVAEALLDKRQPREWNLGLMDYGAAHFTARRSNPNRRSAHYATQPIFKNSRRFVRGRVVAWFSEYGGGSLAALRQHLTRRGLPAGLFEHLPEILVDLEQEGFVVSRRGTYKLAP